LATTSTLNFQAIGPPPRGYLTRVSRGVVRGEWEIWRSAD
jgi:hypothetical protein